MSAWIRVKRPARMAGARDRGLASLLTRMRGSKDRPITQWSVRHDARSGDMNVVGRADDTTRRFASARIDDLEVEVIADAGLQRTERIGRRHCPRHQIASADALRIAG